MKNRIERIFSQARQKKSKFFCAYLTLGYPSVDFTQRLILELESLGVDLIELGFPFSDPLADGPVIQQASEYALRKRVVFEDALRLARSLRNKGSEIPLIFFSYYNPIFHRGFKRFTVEIKKAGFDGLICPDLPPDEDSFFSNELKRQGISVIYLVAPTTDEKRLRLITQRSAGFIYYVSLKGVTGMRQSLSSDLRKKLARIRRMTVKPILVGFGVSNRSQVKEVCRFADGVIVGSAIVHHIAQSKGKFRKVSHFVRSLLKAAKD